MRVSILYSAFLSVSVLRRVSIYPPTPASGIKRPQIIQGSNEAWIGEEGAELVFCSVEVLFAAEVFKKGGGTRV